MKVNCDITAIALENFHQRSFEITFEVYNTLQDCEENLVNDYLHIIGNDEFYESLKYHNEIVYSAMLSNNFQMLENYIVWKYSYCSTRNIDIDYFLIEYRYWKQSIIKYLYPSHSNEINAIYDYLIQNHNEFKTNSFELKKIEVNKKYEVLFFELLDNLLKMKKDFFYKVVEDNLKDFDNDIFLFIKEVIDPLMYKIGQMWQFNEITVAKEHLVTSFVDEMINDFINKNSSKNTQASIVLVSTIGDESHVLPVKILSKFLQTKNYEVRNISSKLSNKELINFIYDLKPDLVFLSVTLVSNIANLKKVVKTLKEDNLFIGKIVVGGQALVLNNDLIEIEGADFVAKDLIDVENYLKSI